MRRLEVKTAVARYLPDVILLCQRPIAAPLVSGYFSILVYMCAEHFFELLAGEVVDLHRVHPFYLSVAGQLDGAYGLFLLAVVASPYLALFPAPDHELADMYGPVHRMVTAGPHGLPDLVHERPGGLFGYPEPYAHIACR